jgi:outer membrane beta-barrel protein
MRLTSQPALAALAATFLWLGGGIALAQEDEDFPEPVEEEDRPRPAPTKEDPKKARTVVDEPVDEDLPPPPDDDAGDRPAARAKPKVTKAAEAPKPKSKPLSKDETIYVVQRKPVVAKFALEVAPQLMQSVNDRFTLHTGGGISGLFHFRENFALQATVGGLWGRDTPMTREIREKESLKPELVQLVQHTWFLTGDLQWSPIYGKVSLADLILGQFSAYVSIGGGIMGNRLRNQFKPKLMPWNNGFWEEAFDPLYDDPVSTNKQLAPLRFIGVPQVTATLGAGIRFYLTEWLGFRLEVRDYIQANRVNHRFLDSPEQTSTVDISNTYMVQVGVSFLTPRLPLGGLKL